jgi:hypothetical protein
MVQYLLDSYGPATRLGAVGLRGGITGSHGVPVYRGAGSWADNSLHQILAAA